MDGQTDAQFDTLPSAMKLSSGVILALLLSVGPLVAHAQLPPPGPPTPDQTLLGGIYKELVDDEGHRARPPLSRTADRPSVEDDQQDRAEGRHRGELGESLSRILGERDPGSSGDRSVAEEVTELQEEERGEEHDHRAEDDEALGVREPGRLARRGGQYFENES